MAQAGGRHERCRRDGVTLPCNRQKRVQQLHPGLGLTATMLALLFVHLVADVDESPTWTVLAAPEGTEFCVVQRG